MNNYHLPSGSGYGWGVCGGALSDEFDKRGLNRVKIESFSNHPVEVDGHLIEAVEGVSCLPVHKFIWPTGYRVGYAFIEDDILFQKYAANLQIFDHLVCGSKYMMDELQSTGGLSYLNYGASSAIQGVDSSKFFYDPEYKKPAKLKDKYIFGSFGKFEFRKGQDIVIRAFAELAKKHSDVMLLCNWYNPWPETAKTMQHSPHMKDNPIVQHMSEIYAGNWQELQYQFYEDLLRSFGIKDSQFMVLRPTTHSGEYANQYRICDTCVFTNRKEAGTNLPLMEALACGTHCVISDAHGHNDITNSLFSLLPKFPFFKLPFDYMWTTKFVHSVGLSELGHYFETDENLVLARMESAYIYNPQGFRENSDLIAKEWTWEKTAISILSALDQ